MRDPNEALNAAERLAPVPGTKETATTEAWLRHYTALGLAAFVAFYDALPRGKYSKPEPGSRPDLGYLISLATASCGVAVTLSTPPDEIAAKLWNLTPEAGSFNGEAEEWLTAKLDKLGINPADIDHRLDPADFRSPSQIARTG